MFNLTIYNFIVEKEPWRVASRVRPCRTIFFIPKTTVECTAYAVLGIVRLQEGRAPQLMFDINLFGGFSTHLPC